jgi:hypothetical protein
MVHLTMLCECVHVFLEASLRRLDYIQGGSTFIKSNIKTDLY